MSSNRLLIRVVLAGVLVASLGLGACGRKGPLDPPPGASLAGDRTAPPDAPGAAKHAPLGPDGKPIAAGSVNRRIPLDALLN